MIKNTESKESERLLASAQRISKIGSWSFNIATGKIIWSKELYVLTGYNKKLPAPSFNKQKNFYVPESWNLLQKTIKNAIKSGEGYKLELELVRKDGTHWFQSAKGIVVKDSNGKIIGLEGSIQDITKTKLVEMKLEKTLMMLKLMNKCNEILIHVSDEIKLTREICEAIVDLGKYKFAWVGYAENDKYKNVRPISYAGFEKDCLKTVNVTWSNTERGRGPTGTAIRSRKIKICKNFLTGPKLKPWKAAAIKRGYASSIALPLIIDGTIGAITVYAQEPNAFDKECIELLKRLASDLSFGIKSIRKNNEKIELDKKLKESEEKYSKLFNYAIDAIFIADPITNKIINCNKSAEKLMGYSRSKILSMKVNDLHPNNLVKEAMIGFKKHIKGKNIQVVTEVLVKNKKRIPVSINSSIIHIQNKVYIQGIFRNITEQKIAENKLKNSESRFRSYFNMSGSGIAITSVDKRWIDVNDELCSMLGYSHDEVLQMKWSEMTYPDDLAIDEKQFNRVLSGKIERYNLDKRFVRKDKSVIWTNLSVGCVRKINGKVDYIIASLNDINMRKVAELELRESEEKFRNLFNNSEVGMFRSRLDGSEILDANNKYLSIIGYTHDEFIGKPSKLVWFDPKKREEMVKILKTKGRVDGLEFELINKAGEVRNCITTLVLYPDEGILEGSIQDITEKKKIEAKVNESEQKYRRLFEAAKDSILILNSESGEITDSNPFIQNMLEYSKEELLGKKIFEISPFKNILQNKEKFLELKNNGYVFYSDLPLETKSGKKIHVEFVSNVYSVGNKNVIQCNIRDITERITFEEAKDTFLSMASHQLRTPLAAIKWVLESLLDEKNSFTLKQQIKLNDLVVSNERIIKLVNYLLNVTRIEFGKLMASKKPVDINELIKESVSAAQNLTDKKNIEIITSPKLNKINCDPVLINEVLENLLVNAINYSSDDSTEIIVRINNRENDYLISVHNDGFIDELTLLKIKKFEKFVRGDYAIKIQPSGSGLGLYITQKLVQLNGGILWLESNIKSGTTFYFTIIK